MTSAFGIDHGEVEKRFFSTKSRHKLADNGDALPDGSFPIKNKKDLKNAERLVGHSKHPAAARKLIARRAKDLGVSKSAFGVEDVEKGFFKPSARSLRAAQKAEQQAKQARRNQKAYEAGVKVRGFPRKVVNTKVSIADVGTGVGRGISGSANKVGEFTQKHPGAIGTAAIAGTAGGVGYGLNQRGRKKSS